MTTVNASCDGRARSGCKNEHNDRRPLARQWSAGFLEALAGLLLCCVLRALCPFAIAADSAKPLYQNDFQASEVATLPADFLVISGTFAVQEERGRKFLELPGSPLDTFGLLFGPSQEGSATATASFHGRRQGRKFPTFGVSLGGAGGYRLQLSPAKRMLEIYKADEPRSSVPFEWIPDSWTRLRIQTQKSASGAWLITGKAWPAEKPEPEKWLITLEEKETPSSGRAGLWGSPYSGTPIRFDDLVLAPAH